MLRVITKRKREYVNSNFPVLFARIKYEIDIISNINDYINITNRERSINIP